MGQLASHNPHGDARAAHDGNRLRVARHLKRARPRGSHLARLACVCSCLFLLLMPVTLPSVAQSGRKKEPAPADGTKREAQRPRTVKPVPAAEPATTPLPSIDDNSDAPPRRPAATTTTSAPAVPSNSGNAGTTTTTVPAEVDDDEVVQVNSNLVPVPASIIDPQGRAVTDLQLADFELLVDGVRKEIGELNRAETPVTMALLFDNSSSLRAGREFEIQAAVRFFKTVMRPVDHAAIYSVATIPTLVRPLTNDVNALVRTIEHFDKPEGATALFDAISAASLYLKPQTGRKVIIIVSDGTDTISDLDFDTTLARALASDCQIYAVQTGHSENNNLRDLAAERRLQEFAAQTGGAVYVPHGANDLNTAFAQIAADLAQQYVLSYYASDDRRDGRFRVFSLRVTTRQGLRVRTRRGYYAPKG